MSRANRIIGLCLVGAAAALAGCADEATTPGAIPAAGGLSNASVPEFNILTTANDDQGFSAATDGTSYMVGIETGNMGPANAFGIVKAQKVLANGTLGPIASTGRIGNTPMVTFDGTHYLLTWTDHNGGLLGPVNIFGQFLDVAGNKVGSVFRVSTEGTVVFLSGVAFGAGKYLVTYLWFDINASIVRLYGRFVSPAGVVTPRFFIANPAATGALNSLATDGNDFLAAWVSGTNYETVKTTLIHNNGTRGPTATLNTSPEPSTQALGVAYVGGKYLVTWSDSIDLHESNVYGRMMTQAGTTSGARITIAGGVGQQIGGTVAVLGQNFFVTWIDLAPDPANTKVRGRFFNTAGAALGSTRSLYATDLVTGKLPITPGPIARGSDAFFVIGRALPGPDPQSFMDLNAWDLHGGVKVLVP
jgi:hypothetical protein